MLVADDLAASPHSNHRENRAPSGSRIWNTRRLPLEITAGPERWGFGDWDRDSNGGNGYDHDLDDPVRMSTWAGQPSVKGRSETVRMVLLTCVSIGITSVHICALCCSGACSC